MSDNIIRDVITRTQGELYLGGCCIIGDKEMPRYYCKKCKKELIKDEVETDAK